MKASDLKPGQFFEFDIDKRKTRCRRTATGYEYIVEIPEEDFTDGPVTPLAVTGWDDEPQSEPAKEYRCFHCGEVFDATGAAEHFGTQMITFPACTIDVAAYRAMEEEVRQYRDEDTDLHKQIHVLNAEMHEKARRAEEDGYARGLRDAKAHPEELGLQPVASEPAPLQLREGGEYVMRDGRNVGPLKPYKSLIYDETRWTWDFFYWDSEGRNCGPSASSSFDLIAEVPPPVEPVQTKQSKGLYRRYIISKTNGEPVDEEARYFVLRYDGDGDDKKHIQACRDALDAYCDSLERQQHLPALVKDLRNELKVHRSWDEPPVEPVQFKAGDHDN